MAKKNNMALHKRPKKEKLSLELKVIYKILDSVSWEVLEKYLRIRREKEFYINRDNDLKIKEQASKDISIFIDNMPELKEDINKLSPILALVPLNDSGLIPQPSFKSLKELKEASK